MGPHLLGFIRLRCRRRESCNVATPLIEELQSKMTEAADTDNSHPIRRPHVELDQRVEYCDAAAEKRPGFCEIDAFRNGSCPDPVAAHPSCVAAVAPNHGHFGGCTHIVIAGKALVTVEATPGVPPYPDS